MHSTMTAIRAASRFGDLPDFEFPPFLMLGMLLGESSIVRGLWSRVFVFRNAGRSGLS